MSHPRVELLFDEFAIRHARGEAPDVREYLARAGAERDSLGRMIDRYLEAAPARRPTEEELVLLQAQVAHEPPLLVLRQRRRLARRAIVDGLVGALGLDPARREKVARYYHELEAGLLDPAGVSAKVWGVLRDLLGVDVDALARTGYELPAPAHALYLRPADADAASVTRVPEEQPRPERDEIDRLFTGRG